MAIVDINNIQVTKTNIGATCPKCGGNLAPLKQTWWNGRILRIISLGTIRPHPYRCTNCKNAFTLV